MPFIAVVASSMTSTELLAVYGLGDSRGPVADETGDVLQRYKGEAAGGVKESAGESAQLQAG